MSVFFVPMLRVGTREVALPDIPLLTLNIDDSFLVFDLFNLRHLRISFFFLNSKCYRTTRLSSSSRKKLVLVKICRSSSRLARRWRRSFVTASFNAFSRSE